MFAAVDVGMKKRSYAGRLCAWGVRLCMQRITHTYFSSGTIRCRSVYRRALSLIEKHLIVDDTGKA